ncbi:MAG: maltose alpha-D-glucosyltransferase [Actinobacteria bacterium]|nr:maltose alpha-D-glucosyltransferase [Actinomycetota bacterium]
MNYSVDDLQWYRDAIIYELHVRAFHDSDADGIGDFRGLTDKLDYLQDLGVTALWLLPFYPSPLRDDGYDIADYTAIHPNYGTMRQFKRFVDEAHKRELKVINELVINHSSDQSPWFRRAVKAKSGTPDRDFYVWSDDPDRYPDVRIIFQDFEHSNWAWSHEAQSYYWHRFYSHQPDLNFDSPAVHRAVEQVLDFWCEAGIDGMRLDAIPYLYEREGTNGENLPETHAYLKTLRAYLDRKWPGRMFLAEANQWPEDAAAYFGDGDECHMNFHFPLMPRLFMAVRMEDRFPVIDILQQTPEIPDACQWAVFLRNHDELTLEMVTDEERDYMYRAYASDQRMRINLGIRRRLAPLLRNNRRLIELLNGLLFSLPGTPVLYYGDEIGMGDNVFLGDRNGVRTPMQWSADRNAGFSRANPQSLYLPVIIDPEYHYETVNVEAQHDNPSSLWWWMKRLIALRKQHPVFGRGSIGFLQPDNPKVLAFVREHEDERVLVVANLSRYAQAVELDLSEHRGTTPVELFGVTPFPRIGELPYFLTLAPHGFYWFGLSHERERITAYPGLSTPTVPREDGHVTVSTSKPWPKFALEGGTTLGRHLPDILGSRRWFGGKARTVRRAGIADAIPVPLEDGKAVLLLVTVEYAQGDPETYVLPLAFAGDPHNEQVEIDLPHAVLARVEGKGNAPSGVLFDAAWNDQLARRLLEHLARRRKLKGSKGEVIAERRRGKLELGDDLDPHVLGAEQSNTSIRFGERFILKLVRRPDEGENPDLEVGRFLTEQADFEHVPRTVGALTYRRGRAVPRTLAVLQELVPNEGDAWSQALDELGRFYEAVLSDERVIVAPPTLDRSALARGAALEDIEDRVGPYASLVSLLGRRTAELHAALASDDEDEAFAPEPFTALHLRSVYQGMRTRARRTLQLLRRSARDITDDETRAAVESLAKREDDVLAVFAPLKTAKLSGLRTRTHGDYHLGQVLWTGRDFTIIDFEGEPALPLGERRIKRSPLRDVAGMLRSFEYAAHVAARALQERGTLTSDEDAAAIASAADAWSAWVGAAFLRGYLEAAEGSRFLPDTADETALLLRVYLLEKTLYELTYELNNRPDWVAIPLAGAERLLDLSSAQVAKR